MIRVFSIEKIRFLLYNYSELDFHGIMILLTQLNDDYCKQKKINGVIYDMSPSAGFSHMLLNGNLYTQIRNQLKNSVCAISMENLDLYLSKDKYAQTELSLRAFPAISMKLSDIFEGLENS